MDLATYRKSRGLTQEQCATELGLRPSSKGWISEIESGERDASLRLALTIEKWSGGKVKAATLSPAAAKLAKVREGRAA
jgi:transcriptional regulator with XRE-family HTH domain